MSNTMEYIRELLWDVIDGMTDAEFTAFLAWLSSSAQGEG